MYYTSENTRDWGGHTGVVLNDEWRDIFKFNKIEQFSDLWDLNVSWFEPPNHRRGGWSGVAKIDLPTTDGDSVGIFLKRQENHNSRGLLHPLHGIPTFLNEWNNLNVFRQKSIPSQTPLLFAMDDARSKAILITQELVGYQPLDAYLLGDGESLSVDARQKLFQQIGAVISNMHKHGFRHSNLYAKHLFVRHKGNPNVIEFDICFIDLENSRYSRRFLRTRIRDLSQLKYRSPFFSEQDWAVLWASYLDAQPLPKLISGEWLNNQINRRANRRG